MITPPPVNPAEFTDTVRGNGLKNRRRRPIVKVMHVRTYTWLVVLVAGTAVIGAAQLFSNSVQGAIAVVLGTGPIIAAHIASGRESPQTRLPWQIFFWSAVSFWLTSVVRQVLVMLNISAAFPSPADAGVIISYSLLIWAFYAAGSIRSAGRNAAAQVDGLILATAASAVVWTVVLAPYMADASVPLNERLLNAVFSLLTTLALAATTRLAVSPGSKTTSYYLLAAGVVLLFLNDVLATLASVEGNFAASSIILSPLIAVMFSAAALHQGSTRVLEPPTSGVMRLTMARLVLLAGALLTVPGLIVWSSQVETSVDVPVLVAASVAISGLVLIRLRMLVRVQERAVELQRIQREANADLAAAASRHAMHRAALRAVMRLGTDAPSLRASLAQIAGDSLQVLDSVGQDAESAIGVSISMDNLPGQLADPIRDLTAVTAESIEPIDLSEAAGGGATACLLIAPLQSHQSPSGALILSSSRPISAATRSNVETLASTVSLALESAALTENLLRRRSERRFRALVENSSDIVLVMDSDWHITFASPAANRLLGLNEQAMLNTHPARWVHPEDWPVMSSVLENTTTLMPTEADNIEVRIRHLDGEFRWFEVRTRDLQHDPEIQGLVINAREITDRKTAEKQLASSEARFRALVQSSADVVAVLDEKGRFSYLSPAIHEMLGYTPDDLIGTPAVSVVAPDDIAAFQRSYPELAQRRLPSGGLTTRRIEAQLRHANGEMRNVDISVTDMRDDPAVGGVVLNARDITVRKALEADLRFQALHDTLTGLANRTMFTQETASALREGLTPGTIGALFIDLDDFKTVNDSLGHAVGDQLLQEVSTRLITSLSPADTAARLGGDEFAVLVVDAPDDGAVVDLAERILALVAQPYRIQGRDIRVTASIGIAFPEDADTDAEVLLRSADVAMYLAKDRGKNRYAVFEAHMHTSVFERLELKGDLVRAIDDGQLRCHYQPIVSLQTGQISGVEALVRWDHPTRGLLSPDTFIPLAEDTGLIIPLGKWVMREACQQLRSWQLRMPARSTLTMSINLSVRQLMHDEIIDDVRDALESASLDPSTVTMEITETTLMHDTDITRSRLDELRRIGVSLAVDDFGTGYSSLQYVQRFPIDIIKIDRSFVTGLGMNPGDGAVVQSMIELAQRLGVHTVAYGIDRIEQVTLLQSLGADLGQGYLFSKPVRAGEIDSLLDASPHESPRFALN